MTTTSTDMESNYYTTRESLDSFNFGGVANSGVASLSNDIAVIKNGVVFSAQDTQNKDYSTAYVLVVISMPTTVTNVANHNGTDIPQIDFTLTAVATQLAYEEDSFGSDYDKDAEYPVYVPADKNNNQLMGEDAADILAVLVAGKDVVVDRNMDLLGLDTNNIDAKGATVTMNGVGPEAYGYLAFLPDAGENVIVSNLNVTGSGFVEVGHYGMGGGQYELNNVTIKNFAATLNNGDKGFNLGCAFMGMGDVVLNNCVMTGTTAVQSGVMPVDLGCGQAWSGYTDGNDNKISTTINGGEYGTIYCWSQAIVEVNGAKVETMYVSPINGTVTIKAGTHIKTLEVNYGTSTANKARLSKLSIDDGATIDTIVFDGNTYTIATWNAYVAGLS